MRLKPRWVLCGVMGLVEFTFSAQASVTFVQYRNSKDYEIQVRNLEVRSVPVPDQKDVELKLDGADGYDGILYDEGMPSVPVIRIYVDGETRISVDTGAEKSQKLIHLAADVVPVQPSAPKVQGAAVPYMKNTREYSRSRYYPSVPFSVEEAGRVKGRTRRLVTLYPVSYNPATRAVALKDHFTVRVKVMPEPGSTGVDRRKVFVFVVGPRFEGSEALQEYAEFKEELGYEVIQIVAQGDLAEPQRIRTALQEIYHDPTFQLEHALIIGDAADVRGHTSTIIHGVTDHYYRSLDRGEYEADINGPDIGVGRFPADNEEQLQAMVDKSIRYSQLQDEDWFSRISWLATDDKWEIAEGSHNYVIDTFTKVLGYLGFFPKAPTRGGDKLYAVTHKVTPEQTVEALKEGRALIHYSGHGAETFWESPKVTQKDVRAIETDALPFVVSNACITGNYRKPESFAETWVRHPQGAIAFWGSMDDTYWPEDDVMERRQYDGIFKDGKRTFKEITDFALGEVWRHFGGAGKSKYYWETYTFFGDPSLSFHVIEK